ncbi:hypothetical protein ERJ75_000927900 [Trypanosoma vivax]|uniref:Uncharacterized protein n=1 Tax=Trypanosoma vivax (strain Y486) TaxID=1055687 RepID=G0TVG8_TRYVY|nr:hypothetical protein TRVL_01140 [Trypanosoma vivax]KAH8612090.1 hypothetical protein ERJ75_000927900 [Trypanosoma vivax]CCC47934.1 conserved hypothetical protein [Trypanosoma vivax Y486]
MDASPRPKSGPLPINCVPQCLGPDESDYDIDAIATMVPSRSAAKFSPCFRRYTWDPYVALLTDHALERTKKSYKRAAAHHGSNNSLSHLCVEQSLNLHEHQRTLVHNSASKMTFAANE